VQQGLDPTDWKPMTSVGTGVREIRIQTGREHRILYVASFADAIYILHAFEKKSRATPHRELELAKRRLAQLLARRPRRTK
jgi:phage-related protein